MTPALHSLWTVRTSSNPRAIWRVDAIDGDRYTLTLVRLDPENHRQDRLGRSYLAAKRTGSDDDDALDAVRHAGFHRD
jgi:hypothetical protein